MSHIYPSTTPTSTVITSPAANIKQSIPPDVQMASQDGKLMQEIAHGSSALPSQINTMPPAGEALPATFATTPTTITSGISTPSATATATTTGGGTSATGPTVTASATTPTTTMQSFAMIPTRRLTEKTDELTKKEVQEEKTGCDRVQKWKTYMEKMLDGGVELMLAEFRLIRGHVPPLSTRMGFDANAERNRFEDVVCIDQTRVRLSCNSYIHANWVSITASRKAILTQLPLRETSSEFWQMVLDTDVQAILLILTHAEFIMFHANGVFPDEQDFLHYERSHVRVGEFKRVVIDKDWTMHVISVRNGDKRRFVHMHHYSGWTHGKQPVRIIDLWKIQSVFRKYSHPHVYVSLSGCGRAGTYAAFEIAHERLHSDNFQKLNISDCVCRARNGRMHSVQRPIQMQTIHASIMEHIMGNKFGTLLPQKVAQKYEEFSTRFNKCAELQEDL